MTRQTEAQARLYAPIVNAKAVFGVSESTLRRAAKRNAIHIYSASGRALVKVSEVAAWIERKVV